MLQICNNWCKLSREVFPDVIVIAVTWHTTYKTTQVARQGRLGTSLLSLVLLRDGELWSSGSSLLLNADPSMYLGMVYFL